MMYPHFYSGLCDNIKSTEDKTKLWSKNYYIKTTKPNPGNYFYNSQNRVDTYSICETFQML